MIRLSNLLILGITGLICFWLYQIKDEALQAKQKIVTLRGEIAQETKTVKLLQAEWSHLTEPSRLQGLARRHLGTGQLQIGQITTFEALDAAVPKLAPLDRDLLEDLAARAGAAK